MGTGPEGDSRTHLLLPPCLGDYLPGNHPVRVVSAIIDRLDISEIEAGYAGGGTSSYNPRMLLKVIMYAYLNNVYSGCQMEKLLVDKFDDIFTQIVLRLHEEGLVSLKVQYIDGTKIESVANKYTFVWKGSTEKNKAKLEANVRSVLEAADMGCKVLKCALTPATAASRTMHICSAWASCHM